MAGKGGGREGAAHGDDGHNSEGTEGSGKHQALPAAVLQGQQHSDEEGFVAQLRK